MFTQSVDKNKTQQKIHVNTLTLFDMILKSHNDL